MCLENFSANVIWYESSSVDLSLLNRKEEEARYTGELNKLENITVKALTITAVNTRTKF